MRKNRKLLSEINITPFVDIILVLLIVFMLTASMMSNGIKVNLPQVKKSILKGNSTSIVVTIRSDGLMYIRDKAIQLSQLDSMITRLAATKEEVIFIRADKTISYGKVAMVMSYIHAAGFNKIALLTNPMSSK